MHHPRKPLPRSSFGVYILPYYPAAMDLGIFGSVQVLHGVNLSLAAGEVVRLVGDNGAGSARSRERAKADRPDAR